MRIFLAGATGVIGTRLVPLLIAAGHEVAGMTRSAGKSEQVRAAGAEPVICDVYDADALTAAVRDFGPDLVLHQLTDLPDDAALLPESGAANSRIRTEGTRNLIAAAQAAGAKRFVAQSIAWKPAGGRGEVVRQHEAAVLDIGGVVVRYGQFYGPGTYYETELPAHPRVHVDEAAAQTIPLLEAAGGVVIIAENA
ncbi:NAD-dependent epimerase/dehydratase family protein [Nocardia brasiliensis]|uniref:NAD-dependent epimerase/dehydratase n=1 Tax=Nocardia brasiliensis (strain ATCC 700358 / HUJEG-1) TaxID=1133849 RepID=K0F143_NOCB7|nr:NAD(P)-dependent oxidoreductase [Nocardia brasiliensis]AFU01406.1 NAD-dependent epimerase/dehydratase [Nocardia brasiliensis ATCC 700358]OCF86743.1 epimerase [Nocardia brasiliensis]